MSAEGDRVLWEVQYSGSRLQCVMRACCTGAELQLREWPSDGDFAIVLREVYPLKSDLFERARELRLRHGRELG